MVLPSRTTIIVAIATLSLAFALGRYSVSNPSTSTSSQKSSEIKVVDNKDTHTQTKIIETKKPDGTTEKTTVIDQVVTDHKDTNKQSDSKSQSESIAAKSNTLNVSLMYGFDIETNHPVYGAAVTKQLAGPITIGLFGLTNRTVGATIGLNF